jgi:hypothetical protein
MKKLFFCLGWICLVLLMSSLIACETMGDILMAIADIDSSSNSSSSYSGGSTSSSTSAPTLQTGRYAWANSGVNMTMNISAGMVTASLDYSGVWSGTYRISGNQLVITVSNPTSEYSFMRGQTYTYTITSSTSFSGNGETWVKN